MEAYTPERARNIDIHHNPEDMDVANETGIETGIDHDSDAGIDVGIDVSIDTSIDADDLYNDLSQKHEDKTEDLERGRGSQKQLERGRDDRRLLAGAIEACNGALKQEVLLGGGRPSRGRVSIRSQRHPPVLDEMRRAHRHVIGGILGRLREKAGRTLV